jgi:hypothetical protein
VKLASLVAGLLLAAAWLAPGQAFAAEGTHVLIETLGSANQPSFVEPKGLAVDQSSGDVYAIDGCNEFQKITVSATGGASSWNSKGKCQKISPSTLVQKKSATRCEKSSAAVPYALASTAGSGNASGSNPYIVEFSVLLTTTAMEKIKCVPGSEPLTGGSGCTVGNDDERSKRQPQRLASRRHAGGIHGVGLERDRRKLGGADLTPQPGLPFSRAELVQVAVDESSEETAGEVYATQGDNQKLDIFASNGEHLGELTEYEETPGNEATLKPLGLVCGVTVDAAGSVYLADANNGIHKYDPKGPVVTNSDSCRRSRNSPHIRSPKFPRFEPATAA